MLALRFLTKQVSAQNHLPPLQVLTRVSPNLASGNARWRFLSLDMLYSSSGLVQLVDFW